MSDARLSSDSGARRTLLLASGWVLALTASALFCLLFAWTWRRWPDVLVDFGHELYVPWRMVDGAQLYGDLAWFNGPLSPYWNALLFQWFGVGVTTLIWANAATFAGILVLLYSVLRGFASRIASALACLTVMSVCGFGQLSDVGNYNFIAPYSHGITHGTLLGLGALAAASRIGGRVDAAWTFICGVCLGLTFLTKPEMFVAALAGVSVSMLLTFRLQRSHYRLSAALAIGVAVPVMLSWLLLWHPLGARGAWLATLGAWPHLAGSDVAGGSFYAWGSGLDHPWRNGMEALRWAATTTLVLLPSVFLAFVPRARLDSRVLQAMAAGATVALCMYAFRGANWASVPRPWPFFSVVVFGSTVAGLAKGRDGPSNVAAAAFSAFALVLTAKMVLNARLYHYGFALGMPAAALVVVAAWDWLPARIEGGGGRGMLARTGVATALLLFIAPHLGQTASRMREKTVVVGSGPDRLLTDSRGIRVSEALSWIERFCRDTARRPTLAVLPEGVTINYLARMRNPTRFATFMPPEVGLFSSVVITDALDTNPPDIILVVHKDTSEYGVQWFGRDYATDIWKWVRSNYRRVERFGDAPLHPGSRFGIDVFVRGVDESDPGRR